MSKPPFLAITLHQPWAWAVGEWKGYETRSWYTPYRGPLLIHAGKVVDADFVAYMTDEGYPFPDPLVRGAIVKIADLTDCIPTAKAVDFISDDEKFFGDYTPDRWAWKLENIVTLPEPIECRGFQKLWRPGESIIARLPVVAA